MEISRKLRLTGKILPFLSKTADFHFLRGGFTHDHYYIHDLKAIQDMLIEYHREKRHDYFLEALRMYIATMSMYASFRLYSKYHLLYQRRELQRLTSALLQNKDFKTSSYSNSSPFSFSNEIAHCSKAIQRTQFLYLHYLWSYKQNDFNHHLLYIICLYYTLLAEFASLHFKEELDTLTQSENGVNL